MTNWTPERIAGARVAVDWHLRLTPNGSVMDDVVALARIGLAVVAPTEADVERVAKAIRALESKGWNWRECERARAAIAAMGGGNGSE